jgi:hypothetical protein
MGYFATIMFVTAVTAGITSYAAAGSSSIGMTITSDREPSHFRDPKDTKYELNGGYTFDSGLILGGSFQSATPPLAIGPARTLKGRLAIAFSSTMLFRLPEVPGQASIGVKILARRSRTTFYALGPVSTSAIT